MYFLNGKEIRNNQLLEELITQNDASSTTNMNHADILLELEEIHFIGDSLKQSFRKLLQPKLYPFGLYIYNPKEGIISLKSFPPKTITLFELNKFDDGSAYCNSYDELFISGGKSSDNKNFWIINNNNFDIKKKNMIINKKNHSMIFLNINEKEEWVFIIGGGDKKTFYYDIKKNYFVNWGDTNDIHLKPALIPIGKYLYIMDSINLRKDYFERTKMVAPNKKWEKVNLNLNNKIINNFPSNYGVSFDSNGKILLLGGNNINIVKNAYIYEPGNNSITLSQNEANDKALFDDKTFYKISNRYNVALSHNLNETKEIYVIDKEKQSLIKIKVEIPQKSDISRVSCNISFNDVQNYQDNKGELIIKTTNVNPKSKEIKYNESNNYSNNSNNYNNSYNTYNQKDRTLNYNQYQTNSTIYNNYNYNNSYNYQTNQKSYQPYIQNIKNNNENNNEPTRQRPRITIIQDEYFPTSSSSNTYSKYKNSYKSYNKKNQIILTKNKINNKPYKKVVYNKNYNRTNDKAKVELNKPGITVKKYIYTQVKKEIIKIEDKKDEIKEKIENEKKENVNENVIIPQNKNVDNDVVEYKNYENNELENKDDDLFVSEEHNQNQNEVIIEENHNNIESNFNEEIEIQQDQNEREEDVNKNQKVDKNDNNIIEANFMEMSENFENHGHIEKDSS